VTGAFRSGGALLLTLAACSDGHRPQDVGEPSAGVEAEIARPDCVPYGPERVELAGLLRRITFAGPPGYGETPDRDEPQTGFYLDLAEPVCASGGTGDGGDGPQESVGRVQLILDAAGYEHLRPHLGSWVTLRGPLMPWVTGHQHAPLLMEDVDVVRVEPVGEQPMRYLERHLPRLRRPAGEPVAWEEGVDPAVARAVHRLFGPDPEGSLLDATVYGVPYRPDRLLVVARSGETAEDYGRRLHLIAEEAGSYRVVTRSRGAGDSYILRPALFPAGECVIVLSETGTEYSWGLVAHRLCGDRLETLGPLPVALAEEHPAGATTVSPVGVARVQASAGGVRVEFHADVVVEPGGRAEEELRRRGAEPIAFRYHRGAFEREP
jgi:hypothetical protein